MHSLRNAIPPQEQTPMLTTKQTRVNYSPKEKSVLNLDKFILFECAFHDMLEFPTHKNTNLLFPTPFYESNITSRILLDSKRSIAMESVSHFHHEADHV
jgi:hypothetical protein